MILFQNWLISTTFLILSLEIPKNEKDKEKKKPQKSTSSLWKGENSLSGVCECYT